MKLFNFQIVRKFVCTLTFTGLLFSGVSACISGGGGVGGGPVGGDGPIGGPNIANVTPPGGGPGLGVNQNAPTMPDIAVGPALDVTLDPNELKGPVYDWRVSGTAATVCRSTETQSSTPPLSPMQSIIFRLFEGSAYAASGGGDSTTPTQTTVTIHRLMVFIQGQIQFNVDGGDFLDWKPVNEGDRIVRALDPYNNVVDTKIKEGGKIELNFLLRLSGEPSPSTFEQAMQVLNFYRTPSNFPTVNLDLPKTCSNNSPWLACKHYMSYYFGDMKALVPAQPNYGANTDFSGLPECPPSS